ncbi:MAG: DUF1559 domain-containing protein [Planctomycetes bacterium]|nr:DUF1559 domain-containing protein [Planctomycetota bacterium]
MRSTLSRGRKGLTLVEVLVAAVYLVVVLAVVVPMISWTRVPARRTLCLNNLRNISLAAFNYTAMHQGAFPSLEDGAFGWPVALLPSLDQPALARKLKETGKVPANAGTVFSFFTCPGSDAFRQPGGLSYVANAGYGMFPLDARSGRVTETGLHSPDIDLDGDGLVSEEELTVNYATGVFWRPHPSGTPPDLDLIGLQDGTSQTLLFAESTNSGPWHSRNTLEIAFVIGRGHLKFEPPPTSRGPLQLSNGQNLGPFAPNANRGTLPGSSPAPSTMHGEVIHVAFCDFRASMIVDSIDPAVFARMMTPAGEQYGQSPVDQSEY